MNNELPVEEEIWKPAVKFGVVIPNCFVSNLGRVRNKNGKLFKITQKGHKKIIGGPGAKSKVNIHIPKNLFKHRQDKGIGKVKTTFTVHRLVIETFKPIDEYPPIPKNDWNVVPESAKEIIRMCCIVDHIDDNPFNNRIDNLRWCTPLENNPINKKNLFGDSDTKQQITTLEELFL
jgi:hypothetical protein